MNFFSRHGKKKFFKIDLLFWEYKLLLKCISNTTVLNISGQMYLNIIRIYIWNTKKDFEHGILNILVGILPKIASVEYSNDITVFKKQINKL